MVFRFKKRERETRAPPWAQALMVSVIGFRFDKEDQIPQGSSDSRWSGDQEGVCLVGSHEYLNFRTAYQQSSHEKPTQVVPFFFLTPGHTQDRKTASICHLTTWATVSALCPPAAAGAVNCAPSRSFWTSLSCLFPYTHLPAPHPTPPPNSLPSWNLEWITLPRDLVKMSQHPQTLKYN